MSSTFARRGLATALAGTVLLLGVDAARPGLTAPLRDGAAAVLGPVERALAPGDSARVARLTRERDALLRERQQDAAAVSKARQLDTLLASPAAAGRRVVPARVVAFSASPAGSGVRRVTLDVGSRDGIRTDLSVIAGAGLVGRVVSVAPWTCDVQVLGDRDVTVGVRAGSRGVLGSLTGATVPGVPPRAAGELTLSLIQQGSVAVGDIVRTLGSPHGRPYVPDVPVGRVTAVDPARGQLATTAAVRPFIDASSLDVVAVVTDPARTTPRPATTGGG